MHTRNAGRGPLPFSAPGSHAFGFCAAPLHVHGAGQKGGGASPHARTQMEGGGACRAGCVPPPILAVPPTPGPCPNGGATFSALRSRGQGVSRRGAGPSLRRRSTPPFVCYARLGERDARGGGGGGCAAPAFPYPVGAQTSPRLCINGGDKGGAAGGPALGVLFDLSGGKGGKGGCVPLCAALHSPFAHRGGVAQPPRRRGRNGAPPALHTSRIGRGATGGRTGGDHAARGGGGTQTVFTSPLPSLNPRSHAALCAGRGGRQRVDEGGRSRESCFPRRLDTRRHVTAVFGLQSRDLGT